MKEPLSNLKFVESIIKAANENKLVVFVGAGISKLCGLPLWGELAHNLLLKCIDSDGLSFTYKDLELLERKSEDSRKKITIARHLMIKQKDESSFAKEIKEQLTIKPEKLNGVYRDNYTDLPRLLFGLSNTIITTNADKILDEVFIEESDIVYKEEDFDKSRLDGRKTIFHIHGSINDVNSMVFSVADYLKRYNTKRFRHFLRSIFSNLELTILIVGYSLSELSLLDYIVSPNKEIRDLRKDKIFLLDGYYSYEDSLVNEEENYYKKEFGIQLIPYCKDKHGFQELVYVLKGLNNQVCSFSKKNINDLNELSKLTERKPTKTVFSKFKNKYFSIEDNKKEYLLTKIKESDYCIDWANKIRRDNVFKDELENTKPLSEKEYTVPLIYYFFLSLEINDQPLNRYIRKFVLSLLETVNSMKSIEPIIQLDRALCKKVSTDYLILSTDTCYQFMEKNKEVNKEAYWCLFLCYNNNVLTRLNKCMATKYLYLLLSYFYESNDKHYYYESFVKSYSLFYLEKYPNQLFDGCLSLVEQKLKKDKYIMWTLDCFTDLKDNDNDFDSFYKIVSLLIKVINYLDNDKITSLFNSYSKMEDGFYKNLSIYILNQRFDILRDSLITILNPNDKDIYAEVYCLVENNYNYFTENEYKQIVDYATSISFDKYSDTWNKYAKYYMLSLLSNTVLFSKDNATKSLFGTLSRLVEVEEMDDYRGMPKPHELSKKVWSAIYPKTSNDVENSVKQLKPSAFVDYYKACKDFDKQGVGYVVIKENIKNADYLSELINLQKTLPIDLIESIIAALMDNDFSPDSFATMQSFIYKEHPDYKKLKKYSYTHLYFFISNNIDHLYGNYVLRDGIFEYMFSDVLLDEKDDNKIDEYYGFWLANNVIFTWLCSLIKVCSKEKWPDLKMYIEPNLLNSGISYVIKASIVACSSFVWNLDRDYYKNHLKDIFDNVVDGKNISYDAFKYGLFYNSDFVLALSENGILYNLLDDEAFSNGWNYVYLILCMYMEGNIPNDLLTEVLKTKDAGSGFNYFIELIRDVNHVNGYKSYLQFIFESVTKIDFKNSGRYAITMLEKSKLLINVNGYIPCIEKLLSVRNSSSYAKDFIKIIDEGALNELQIEQIVIVYFRYLGDTYLFEDEVTQLFKKVNWTSEKRKTEAINILVNKNPEFLKLSS